MFARLFGCCLRCCKKREEPRVASPDLIRDRTPTPYQLPGMDGSDCSTPFTAFEVNPGRTYQTDTANILFGEKSNSVVSSESGFF